MASKFYIYKSGRWLELDIATGTLEGTREKPRFLYVHAGTLKLARRTNVLRGLAALQSGLPTSVKKGLTLPRRRKHRRRHRSPKKLCSHQCCSCVNNQVQVHSCPTPITINSIRQDVTTSTRNYMPAVAVQTQQQTQTSTKINEPVKEIPASQPTLKQPADNCQSSSKDESSESSESPAKELYIDMDDVKYIRDYLEKHPKIFGHIDREKFDVDDYYRNVLLFKLNPLVLVKKGNLKGRITKEHIKPSREMTQREFAATLGLTHINDQPVKVKPAYRTRQKLEKPTNGNEKPNISNYSRFFQHSSSGSDDKENSTLTNRQKSSKLAGISTQGRKSMDKKKRDNEKSKGDEKGREREREKDVNVFKKKNMVLRKSKVGKKSYSGGREYSSLEDHAIVAWVSGGRARERRVNGNKLWRELSHDYSAITGQERSWHSLRNRYLRYILPALGALHLEPSHASRLRAAAARGKIKLRRKPSSPRRNSIHSAGPVRSAWNRRPRDPAPPPPEGNGTLSQQAGDSSEEESAPRTRKSQTGSSKSVRQTTPDRKSPDGKSPYGKSPDGKSPDGKSPDGKSPARKLRSSGGLTYAAITEAFANRRKGSSVASGQPSQPPSPPRRPGRRLFNPRAV